MAITTYGNSGGGGSVTSVNVSGGTTGLTYTGGPITTSGTITATGTLDVDNGGTGATTLTGYVKGNGTSAFTASASIPGADISGNISGNSANVTGTVLVANGGTGATALTGYVKGNGTSAFSASANVPSGDVTGLASVATSGSAADLSSGTLPAARMPALTGDVTTTVGTVATAISAGAVTNAKLANVGTQTFKGRTTAGTGNPEDLTVAQATALLDVFTSLLKGLVPASGGGTSNFLRADGNWAAPPSGPGGSTIGTTTVDFGSFPGSSHVVKTVSAPGISGSATLEAWLLPKDTADHTADEHVVETIKVLPGSVTAGTSFTIHAVNISELNEPIDITTDQRSQIAGGARGGGNLSGGGGGIGTRIYGVWSVGYRYT